MNEAQIEAQFMNAEQRHCFEQFVALGSGRSLPDLEKHLAAIGTPVAMSSLKRWSSKFKWFELAIRTESEIAQGVAAAALPAHEERVRKELETIHKLKETFYTEVEAGNVKITSVDEFIALLKAERLILGDPSERSPEQTNNTQINIFAGDDADVAQVIRTLAERKHGLPPPTYEQPEEHE